MIVEELTEIEGALQDVLEKVRLEWVNQQLYGDKKWTYRIKELLGQAGTQMGYQVCSTGFDCYHGEWLYDLVWYEENDEKRLISVPLIVESEWNRGFGNIKYDFEKLLLANADHRLMICQARPKHINSLLEYFTNAVKDYKLLKSGDRFLIAILDDYMSGNFIYKIIIKE